MRIISFLKPFALSVAVLLTLSACKSVEERAEEFYQRGLELRAAGDFDRAVVELRNVFQLDGSHQEARHALAEIMRDERKDRNEAYGQYLRLVEQYPDDLKARLALSEMAFLAANWTEVERHGAEAERIAPEDPRVKAITISRAYRAAALADDAPTWREQANAARALLEAEGENEVLRNVLIDNDLRNGDTEIALEQIDALLESRPDNQLYWRQRLTMLGQLGDSERVEAQLREMVQRFPDDKANKEALLRFYLSRGQQDAAEDFLRELVALAPGTPGPKVDLIRFLTQIRGTEAAMVEIDAAIETQTNPVPFRAMRAGLDFETGRREDAVAALETLLAEAPDVIAAAEADDEIDSAETEQQYRAIKITLAKMLLAMGNDVGARARVEDVLAEDSDHVEALKMRAGWLIQGDDTDAAISALRSALDRAPEDADAMTLMSQAYTRSGRPELAREFLALAVEASGNAPEESIRYARLLISEERYVPAEDILLPALRLAPGNVDILIALGQLYLAMEDTGRAEQVVRTLRAIDTDQAQQAALGIEAQSISQQNGVEQAMQFLEGIAGSEDASLASKVSLVQARLRTGDAEGALTLARDLHAADPDNDSLKGILASIEAVNGNLGTAEALYRGLLDSDARRPGVWLELAQLRLRQGDPAAAAALVDEGLAALPDDGNLLWAKASYLERGGDIDGAIDIYDRLYERNSDSVVVANNLASLLATYRTDEASLERAWTIARRFRDVEIPAMQDTYGWIAHRRGDSAEALSYLEAAAAGLENDPVVQYHLGMVYLALNNAGKALDQFRRAVELAGANDPRDQIAEARAKIAELEAAQDAPQAAEN